MRKFIQIVTEAKTASFRLHPALDPEKYQITDNLRDVGKWRACTLVANNGGTVGEMQEVGYIMISATDDTIIPISRDDEHNMGRDLLHDLVAGEYGDYLGVVSSQYGDYYARKKGAKRQPALDINPDNFAPVWPYGNNYVYAKSDVTYMLPFYEKFLSYGGADGIIKGANDLNKVLMRMSDLIALKGDVTVQPGKLGPVGQVIYNGLVAISEAILAAGKEPDRIQAKPAFVATARLLKIVDPHMWSDLGLPLEVMKGLPARLRELQKNNDVAGLADLVFGFQGIKIAIHAKLKKHDPILDARTMAGVWGDVEMAIDMLARL